MSVALYRSFDFFDNNEVQDMGAAVFILFRVIFNDVNNFCKSCQLIYEKLLLFTGRWQFISEIRAYGSPLILCLVTVFFLLI